MFSNKVKIKLRNGEEITIGNISNHEAKLFKSFRECANAFSTNGFVIFKDIAINCNEILYIKEVIE